MALYIYVPILNKQDIICHFSSVDFLSSTKISSLLSQFTSYLKFWKAQATTYQ